MEPGAEHSCRLGRSGKQAAGKACHLTPSLFVHVTDSERCCRNFDLAPKSCAGHVLLPIAFKNLVLASPATCLWTSN